MLALDLSGKTAFVSGSTQGIGYAIAQRLAQSGAKVGINGRSEDKVTASIAELTTANPDAEFFPVVGDLADATQANKIIEDLKGVDILVNNLGIFGSTSPLEISDEEWERYYQVNVLSAVRLIRGLLPSMMDKGWGRVVSIASDSAIVTPEEMIHYGVSKTSILAVTRGFAKAAKGTGVTVNSVVVGPTHTKGVETFVYELVDSSLPWDKAEVEFMTNYRPQSLIQRFIEPEEVANMVTYLSSPLASATTGGALRVDGGYTDSILP